MNKCVLGLEACIYFERKIFEAGFFMSAAFFVCGMVLTISLSVLKFVL